MCALSMIGRVARRSSAIVRGWRFRMSGYKVGGGASLGRCQVFGQRVSIGEGVRIGDRVRIQGEEIEIAPNVTIENDVNILARHIRIGAETLIESGVTVGGLQTRQSSLAIGANCVVLHRSYLNTTYPITIEDDVGIGGYCMIFTHGLWQSAFEGYPVTFGPVTIRKGVWLPWHVFVMPGVEIGEGATIGAGSVVVHSVPRRSLAIGSPARVVKLPPDYPIPLTKTDLENLVGQLLRDFAAEMLAGGMATHVEEGPDGYTLSSPLGMVRYGMKDSATASDVELLLGGQASSPCWIDLLSREWKLDLGRPLHRDLKFFIRRLGVRLLPVVRRP